MDDAAAAADAADTEAAALHAEKVVQFERLAALVRSCAALLRRRERQLGYAPIGAGSTSAAPVAMPAYDHVIDEYTDQADGGADGGGGADADATALVSGELSERMRDVFSRLNATHEAQAAMQLRALRWVCRPLRVGVSLFLVVMSASMHCVWFCGMCFASLYPCACEGNLFRIDSVPHREPPVCANPSLSLSFSLAQTRRSRRGRAAPASAHL